jgi:hypothetical protein
LWVVIACALAGRYQYFGKDTVSNFRAKDGDSMFLQRAGINCKSI